MYKLQCFFLNIFINGIGNNRFVFIIHYNLHLNDIVGILIASPVPKI